MKKESTAKEDNPERTQIVEMKDTAGQVVNVLFKDVDYYLSIGWTLV